MVVDLHAVRPRRRAVVWGCHFARPEEVALTDIKEGPVEDQDTPDSPSWTISASGVPGATSKTGKRVLRLTAALGLVGGTAFALYARTGGSGDGTSAEMASATAPAGRQSMATEPVDIAIGGLTITESISGATVGEETELLTGPPTTPIEASAASDAGQGWMAEGGFNRDFQLADAEYNVSVVIGTDEQAAQVAESFRSEDDTVERVLGDRTYLISPIFMGEDAPQWTTVFFPVEGVGWVQVNGRSLTADELLAIADGVR